MKSIRLNIRALSFDGNTALPSKAKLVFNAKADAHELIGANGSPLAKLGVLQMRDLVALDLISATNHAYVSRVGHSGQAGITSFVVRSCHVGLGRRVNTSPTRETNPSTGASQVGPFALGPTDELVLTSNGNAEQSLTIALLVGTDIEVERLIDRSPPAETDDESPSESHAETHESGGDDEIDVTGLPGVLAEPQTPIAHKASHENEGDDEINVSGLSGVLADPQTPASHASSHQNGNADEINVAGLSGLLADPQAPLAHATSHKNGGSDEIRIDQFKVGTDVTTLNATTTEHGLLPKLSGDDTEALSGAGTWEGLDVIDFQDFETPGTHVGGWTKPDRGSTAIIIVTGAGGGGGGGSAANTNLTRMPGSGGGGGAKHMRILPLTLLGSSETVIVGSGGGGGGALADGTGGGASSFGSWCFAGGGGGGMAGATSNLTRQGGGGGGIATSGTLGTTTFARNEGKPGYTVIDTSSLPMGASGGTGCRGGHGSTQAGHAEWGGGGGGGTSSSAGLMGGTSLHGGGGGGAGGFYNSGAKVPQPGGLSGTVQDGGGAANAGVNTNSGPVAAGTSGAPATNILTSGSGGGGGGGSTINDGVLTNGTDGGDGGFPGGGGGGGGVASNSGTAGSGGDGGHGAVYVYVV